MAFSNSLEELSVIGINVFPFCSLNHQRWLRMNEVASVTVLAMTLFYECTAGFGFV